MKKHDCALALLCIVNQIQDYARHNHRQFVMRHLAAWHARHRKPFTRYPAHIRRILDPSDPSFSFSDDANNTMAKLLGEYLDTHPPKPAKWFEIKAQTRTRRREKMAETRRRNKNLRKASTLRNVRRKIETKRGRGRPRKA